jgi:ketosteroid isomerase-like protein
MGARVSGSFATPIGDFQVRVERFIDAGAEEVVVFAHFKASGSGSGVPVEGEHGYVWTVQGGQAVRFRWFQSHQEALEAAGLLAD